MPARNSGFSLVELMITVGILAVAGVAAAPNLMNSIGKYRVEGAVQALATEMSLTRMRAISANRTHHVAFDFSNQKLDVYLDDDNDWSTSNEVIKSISLSSAFPNVSLDYNSATGVDGTAIGAAAVFGGSSSPVRVTFRPNGMVAESGAFYVLPLADKGNRNDRMRAVKISLVGQVTRQRPKSTNTPPWEEY